MTKGIEMGLRINKLLIIVVVYCLPIYSFAAERIVSIGGSITEILFELELQNKIIAVDTTSLYPPSVKSMQNVGYMRALAAEPIIALNPDLILYQDGSGPAETIEKLQAAGMNVIKISHEPSVEGVVNKIQEVSHAVDKVTQGEALVSRIRNELVQLEHFLSDVETSARVMFVLSFDESSALVAGSETGANGIISMAKAENVANGFSSYKPLGAEAIVELAPEFVVTTHRAVKSIENEADILDLPVLQLTPAARNDRLIVMDGLLLLGFGPRLATAANELAKALYSTK